MSEASSSSETPKPTTKSKRKEPSTLGADHPCKEGQHRFIFDFVCFHCGYMPACQSCKSKTYAHLFSCTHCNETTTRMLCQDCAKECDRCTDIICKTCEANQLMCTQQAASGAK